MRPLLLVLFTLLPLTVPALASENAARHFDTVIAPILSRHCLECHDTANREGKLDLSKRSAAFAAGKKSPVIVPGSAAKSKLWASVESDEMPEDRPSLSTDEKKQLKAWIDAGAVWPGEEVDPLAHMRSGGGGTTLSRRLTREEYIATVRAATGVELVEDAVRLLPAETRAEGFTNTAYHLGADFAHIQAYAALAALVAERMDAAPLLKDLKGTDDKTLRSLVERTGRRLLRGPVKGDELATYLALAREGAGSSRDLKSATSLLVEVMLQSPRFLYRIEVQQGDGKPRPVSGTELASRLSYLVWGGPPDEALLRAAESGELSREDGIAKEAARLLADPRAELQSLRFAREWLDLDRLDSLRPDPKKFPDWTPGLAADLKEETLAFYREAVWTEKLALSSLFNAPFTMASPRLAAFYGFGASGKKSQGDLPLGPEPLVLYRFNEGKDELVRNRAGLGENMDLRADKPGALGWKKEGGLELKSAISLSTSDSAENLVASIQESREFTISLTITPGNLKQEGPARILTLSKGTSERNLTIGQEGDSYEIRLRAKGADRNGMPGWRTNKGTVKPERTHLLLVRETSGKTRLFLNGKEAASRDLGGDLGEWKDDFRLLLGNETSGDRPWVGTFHEVAIYDRALAPDRLPAVEPEWRRLDLSAVPGRGGLLTQGSLLTIGGDEASMVTRGLFVLHEVLGSGVTSAPPGTDTTPIPAKVGQSRRAVSEIRISKSECAGCHAKFEPLAFGFEKFDGIGRWREKDEHGNTQREDGQILFPGEAEPVAYGSVGELMDLLAGSDRVARTITRKVTQFAVGRPLGNADAAVLDTIHARALAGGGTWPALIEAIAQSDLIRLTPTEPKS